MEGQLKQAEEDRERLRSENVVMRGKTEQYEGEMSLINQGGLNIEMTLYGAPKKFEKGIFRERSRGGSTRRTNNNKDSSMMKKQSMSALMHSQKFLSEFEGVNSICQAVNQA